MVSEMNREVTASRSKAEVVTAYRRGQILDAARERFLKSGLAGTTMSEIARAAGVAKGTVYLYFPSKDAVLHQILRDDLAELRDETLPAIQKHAPIEERLRAYLKGMVAFYEARKNFIEICQVELGPELRKKARRQLGQLFAEQESAWRDALVASGVARTDAERHARAIASLGYGLALQRIRGWLDGPIDTDIESAARLAWKGVARP